MTLRERNRVVESFVDAYLLDKFAGLSTRTDNPEEVIAYILGPVASELGLPDALDRESTEALASLLVPVAETAVKSGASPQTAEAFGRVISMIIATLPRDDTGRFRLFGGRRGRLRDCLEAQTRLAKAINDQGEALLQYLSCMNTAPPGDVSPSEMCESLFFALQSEQDNVNRALQEQVEICGNV